jgi:hypothetical protein
VTGARRRRFVLGSLGAAVALLSIVLVGPTIAAAEQFLPGAAESAGGAYVAQSSPAYWVWEGTEIWTVPVTVPALLSPVVTAPTRLAATGGSYVLDAAKAGNTSVRWEFEETTGAPTSAELEVRILVGLSNPSVAIKLYVETQAAVLTRALTFFLYWDAGKFAPTGLTVETMQASFLVCSSIGHCP